MFAKSYVALAALSILSQSQLGLARPVRRERLVARAADFGSCSTPSIIFAAGLDNRKETAFEPKDLQSFNHDSAQAIDIITKFMCDTLTNTCGANQDAKDLCAQAITAADGQTAKTGKQADAFNAVFGQTTNFAAVQPLDDQGNPVGAAGAATAAAAASSSSAATGSAVVDAAASSTSTAAAVTVTATGAAAIMPTGTDVVTVDAGTTATDSAAATATGSAAAGGADFGSCTTPSIVFAAGLDNRKETAFEPKDLQSFNHDSAQNIDIITQFMCDTLTNTCNANQAAKDLCAQAITAADGQTAKTGEQADAFNAVFGETTNFAAVQPLDDQGNPVAGSAAGSGSTSAAAAAATTSATAAASTSAAVSTSSSVAAAASTTAASSASASASGSTAATGGADFGSCSTPEIKFAAGLDGRKETAFATVDTASFNHGSADNIKVISDFICDALTNTCGANQAAKDQCTQAQTAVAAQDGTSGAAADAFNAAFGQTTDFAAVQEINNQGQAVAGSGAAAATTSAAAAASTATAKTQNAAVTSTGGNLQTFTGSLGATAPAVTDAGNGQFAVEGNATFNNEQNALVRSCDVQHNQCANAANASGNKGDLTVAACGTQQDQCNAAAKA